MTRLSRQNKTKSDETKEFQKSGSGQGGQIGDQYIGRWNTAAEY